MLVEIPVAKVVLGKTVGRMREWLDSRHCETCSFRQSAIIDGIVLQIGFLSANDAKAFADQFGGTVTPETETIIPDRGQA
jgi:hypothetical protein